jgi:hypothetical protein
MVKKNSRPEKEKAQIVSCPVCVFLNVTWL